MPFISRRRNAQRGSFPPGRCFAMVFEKEYHQSDWNDSGDALQERNEGFGQGHRPQWKSLRHRATSSINIQSSCNIYAPSYSNWTLTLQLHHRLPSDKSEAYLGGIKLSTVAETLSHWELKLSSISGTVLVLHRATHTVSTGAPFDWFVVLSFQSHRIGFCNIYPFTRSHFHGS